MTKGTTGNYKSDLFCKIICGDKSDNIPGVFKKCGIKTALKLWEDSEKLQIKLKNEQGSYERMERNRVLIDFNNIPSELCDQFEANNLHLIIKQDKCVALNNNVRDSEN